MTQTVVITGANRGVGLEFVRQYLENGDRVHACCRQPAKAAELQQLQQKHPSQLTLHQLDVVNPADCEKLATTIQEPVDILLNNAGIYGPKGVSLGDIDTATWMDVLQTNTIAPIKITELMLNNVVASKAKKVIFISSKMGSIDDNTSGRGYIYRSAKAALNACVKSLSIDLEPQRVIATAFHPGWVRTDMGGDRGLISTEESVTALRSLIEKLTSAQSGRFLNFDGVEIPW